MAKALVVTNLKRKTTMAEEEILRKPLHVILLFNLLKE